MANNLVKKHGTGLYIVRHTQFPNVLGKKKLKKFCHHLECVHFRCGVLWCIWTTPGCSRSIFQHTTLLC